MKLSTKTQLNFSKDFRSKSVSRTIEFTRSKTTKSPNPEGRYSIFSILKTKNIFNNPRKSVNKIDLKQASEILLEKKIKIEQELENILGVDCSTGTSAKVSTVYMKSESKALKDFRQIRKSIPNAMKFRFKFN